jgi:hypothetical protein
MADASDISLTREDDEFVRDRLRWVVTLNNGETIYEDDGREGVEPASAWVRLKEYCQAGGFWIIEMWLQFRSNRVEVKPADAEGYFFVKEAFGVWGAEESYSAYIAGAIQGDNLMVSRYKVPELVLLEEQVRPLNRESPTVICRPVDTV